MLLIDGFYRPPLADSRMTLYVRAGGAIATDATGVIRA